MIDVDKLIELLEPHRGKQCQAYEGENQGLTIYVNDEYETFVPTHESTEPLNTPWLYP